MTDSAATATPTLSAAPAVRVQQAATRAAAGVEGVHELGTPGGRALVRAMGRVPGGRTTYGPGVSVEVGERAAAVDVSLVIEHGSPAPAVGEQVRETVREQVRRDTGLDVVEVNVTVVGLHHPDDDVPVAPVAPVEEPVEPAGEPGEPFEPVEEPVVTAAAGTTDAEPTGEPVGPDVRDAGEDVQRIVARAVEDVSADVPDTGDGAQATRPAPTVVLPAGPQDATPDVVVAETVVLADAVVVDPQQVDQQQGDRQQDDQQQDERERRQG